MGVTGSRDNNEKKPVVLIIGGGYAGVGCAKALDETGQFFVVLIDRKSYFFHNIGALRATVEPEFAERIITPYNRLLKRGCVVQAEVTSISQTAVQVHGHAQPIHFDYLVIATGTSYAFPSKIAEPDRTKAIHLYRQVREKLDEAEKILIIGGGPVGIELASEIATDFPKKKVTMIHSQPTLLTPGYYNEKLYPRIQSELESLGVEVLLNDRINLSNNPASNYIEGKQNYVTERAKASISSDLTFICTGAHVNNKSILNGPLKSKINSETGRITVNEYLQVDGYENIFAIGDIADKEDKLAYLAGEQATYVAKFIELHDKKKSKPSPYKLHENRGLFISLGRNRGIGQLPFKNAMLIGNFPVKMIKSKGLFADRYRSELNYKSDSDNEDSAVQNMKLHSMQSLLSLSEEEAQHFLAGLPLKNPEPGQTFI